MTPVSQASNPAGTGQVQSLLATPGALLLITGSLIGMNFPLGKIAGEAGVSPPAWALLISLGVASALLPALIATGSLHWPRARIRRYTLIASLLSFVGPNLLLFSVIPHTGAGYAGLMFALSPVFTLSLAAMLGMRTPCRLGRIGILLGLVGAVLVSLSRGADGSPPDTLWSLAALAIPLALAAGNVYRSRYWPEGAQPNVLAFWGHACSSAVFIVLLLAIQGELGLVQILPVGGTALLQMLVSAMTFPVFFRLQQKGGPVMLSQIGYVAAAVGLLASTLFLGERYSAETWLGAGIIALGVGFTLAGQRHAE